jgi:probable F420-dependent oxidoreductase
MLTSVMFSGNGDLTPDSVASISSSAEKKGFDGLWFGETTIRDASILATVAALATKRIHIGTSIINVYTRSAGQLALIGATLNELSKGRFTLGLGASTAAIVEGWHGQRFERPIKRITETAELLRLYFSGERFSFSGSFYAPVKARLKSEWPPDLALAALNDKMISVAATLSDRVILNLYPADMIHHAKSLIDEACKKAGREKPPLLSVMLYAYVLGDDPKGVDAATELVAFYSSAPAYSKLISKIGFEPEAKAMLEHWKAGNREAVKSVVTRQIIDRLMVLGKIQDLRERVKVYHENGVDDVLIAPCPMGDYRANVDEIIQHFF